MSDCQVYPIQHTLTALEGIRDTLATVQRTNPLASTWLLMPRVLVPEWQRYQANCLNVRTGDFLQLSRWILDQAGQPALMLVGLPRQRFLQRVIQAVHAQTPLQVLGESMQWPGFSHHLGMWLDEMKQQEISVATFQAYAEEIGDPREQDLAQLYSGYEERLQASLWLDAANVMLRACQVREAEESPLSPLALLGVAGYVQFSPLQTRLLRCLVADTRTRIFLPVHPAYRNLTAATIKSLDLSCQEKEDMSDRTVHCPPVRGQMEAPSQEQEVRGVLRAIKRLWVMDKVPLSDIILCVTHMDSYAPLLDAVAAEYGVPLDLPIPLSRHPLYVLLRQILTLLPDLQWRQCWQVLRSPFLYQAWLSAEELDTVYHLTAACRVIQGQAQWDTPFAQDYTWDEAGYGLPELPDDERADLQVRLQALWSALQPRTDQSYLDWIQDLVAASSDHTVRLTVPDMLEDPERQQGTYVLEIVRQVVADLQMEAVHWPFATEAAARDGLLQRLASITYRLRGTGDAIRVLTFSESWMLPTAHLFVLGMNERVLPHSPTPGPFYAWRERSEHRLPLRQHKPDLDKLRWAYLQANCGTALYLSRPTEVTDLPSTAPSPFWAADGHCQQMEHMSVPRPDQAASRTELLQALLRMDTNEYPMSLRAAAVRARKLAHITHLRHAHGSASIYTGHLASAEIQAELQAQFGHNHTWSPTALSTYAQCPMGFLVKYVLRLAPPPVATPGLDVRTRGLLLHAILRELYQWLRDEQVALVESHWDRICARLDHISREQWASAGQQYRFQPYPLARFELRELKRYAQWCIRNELATTTSQVEWEPWELEWNTAGAGVVIAQSGGRPFRLRGIVDRLDRNQEGQIRVIDYKLRKSPYNRTELDLAVVNQAVLYRLAAQEAGHAVKESGYRLLGETAKSKLSNVPTDAEATAMLKQIQGYQNNIRRGVFPNIPGILTANGRQCTGYCELADFCQPTYGRRLGMDTEHAS